MITAIVLLALALLGAVAFIVRSALTRYFDRATAFERVWSGDMCAADDRARPLDFRAWVARFGGNVIGDRASLSERVP